MAAAARDQSSVQYAELMESRTIPLVMQDVIKECD